MKTDDKNPPNSHIELNTRSTMSIADSNSKVLYFCEKRTIIEEKRENQTRKQVTKMLVEYSRQLDWD